ncbi:sulfatase [Chitinophaga sp. GCM10012297]|uniref:Sulfatase n=1 Tax=Chitinophaga chungangae TaxID=2821488 RepID=A0ABS3YJT1_9BACT|nr:sulfatase [Chitinophaga chungangae]MBO9154705.1 sulfatase [Chitinophaga chungangae]
MNRTILAFFICIHLAVPAGAQKTKPQPGKGYNIVLFIADDLGVNDITPYGNKIVHTPNLEKFSKESLLFKKAFAGSPTCGPSRSTIFTGLMPIRHGGHGNHSGVSPGTRSLVQYLQPLGYRVAIAGKLHVGPEEIFPFEHVSKTNVPEPGHEKKPGLNYDLNMGPVDQWLRRQQKDTPFMLIVADHSPHVVWPEKYTYDPDKVDIPGKHIDTKETRVARARYYTDISKMDNNLGRLLSSLEKNGLAENTIVIFTADQGPQWPFAKWNLYDDGIATPLMVRWPGTIKGGGQTSALVSLADLTPTIVEAAGGEAPRDIDGQSFLPVLTGAKDTHSEYVFATHTGDKMMNRAPARMLRTERYKYILNLAPEILYTTHIDLAKDHDGGREYWDSWRAKSFAGPHAAAVLWRYHNRPEEELYDLETDPQELHNLAADPGYAELIARYRIKMAEWRTQQHDSFTGPEEIKETPQKGKKPVAPYVFLD